MNNLEIPAIITKRTMLTHDTCSFILETKNKSNFIFSPGEAIQVFITNNEKKISRFYTPIPIPNSPNQFELIIKRYDNGQVTPYIHTHWKVNTSVIIHGPIDRPHYIPNQWEVVNLLAGGTGLTPMLGILRQAKFNQEKTKFNLIFANKTEDDIICRQELEEIAFTYPNLTLTLIVEKSTEQWTGKQGFVTTELLKEKFVTFNQGKNAFFFCGPFPMLKALKESINLELGFSEENIQLP